MWDWQRGNHAGRARDASDAFSLYIAVPGIPHILSHQYSDIVPVNHHVNMLLTCARLPLCGKYSI